MNATDQPILAGKITKVKIGTRFYIVRDELKSFLDSYETYFDKYIELMDSIEKDDPNYLYTYMELMSKLEELSNIEDDWDDLTTDEEDYYLYVLSKVNTKLLEASTK